MITDNGLFKSVVFNSNLVNKNHCTVASFSALRSCDLQGRSLVARDTLIALVNVVLYA